MEKNKKAKNYKKASAAVLVALFCYLLFSYGYILGKQGVDIGIGPSGVSNYRDQNNVDFSLFWEAWDKLKDKSMAASDPKEMLYGSISGLLSSTKDPYTTFLTPNDNKRFREDIQGEFSGIGVELTVKNGLPTVVAPISGYPAEEAGLKANDVILEVDGTKTSEIGFNDIIDKIRGEVGTKVKLKVISGDSEDPREISIERKNIVIKSVEWSYEKNSDNKTIVIVKVRQFGDDTENLFDEMANDVIRKSPDGMIIDLRNNPGGYLETAVSLASYFVEDGLVLSEKGKNDKTKEYKASGHTKLKNFSPAILINEGSASASEIFAGALRDRLDSKLIGKKSFGKGSVQELIDLSDGSAVKITVAKWYTPSGQQINGEGINPDVDVEEKEETSQDEQLDEAKQSFK